MKKSESRFTDVRNQRDSVRMEMKRDKMGYLFLTLLLCLLVFISCMNWTHFEQHLNDDIAGEALYMKKVYDTGNPFTREYASSFEMLATRSWPIFCIVHSFTQDSLASIKATTVITTLLLALSICFLFRALGWAYPEVLLATVSYIGLMSVHVSQTIYHYHNAYVMFCIALCVTLGILIRIRRTKEIHAAQLIILLLIAFYFGMCGIKMLLYLYFPVICMEFISLIYSKLRRNDICKKSAFAACAMLFSYICGLAVYGFVLLPYLRVSELPRLNLAIFWTVLDDLWVEIAHLIQAVGIIILGAPLASLSGFLALYMVALVAVLILGISFLRETHYIQDHESGLLKYLFMSCTLFLLYFTITDYGGAERYWLQIPIIIAFAVAIIYRYMQGRKDLFLLKNLFSIFIISGVILNMAVTYKDEYKGPSPLQLLTDYLQESGCKRITGPYFGHGSSITLLSHEEIQSIVIEDDDQLPMWDWITDRTQFSNDDDPMTIVLTQIEKETWMNSDNRNYILSIADQVSEVAGYNVYYYEKNPLAFNLMKFGKDARFNFLTLSYTEGAYLDDGRIMLGQDAMQFGPYVSLDAGTYDIEICGDNLDKAVIDVITENVGSFENLDGLTVEKEKATFSIHADERMNGLEIRCSNPSEETVAVRNITIKPKDQTTPLWL